MTTPKTTIALAATAIVLTGACDTSMDPIDRGAEELLFEEGPLVADRRLPLEDGEERFGEGVTLLDRVELVGGTQLSFVHLDIEGNESLGMIERRPAGANGLSELKMALDLEEASFIDLYLALTEPGVEVPATLRRLSVDHQRGEQGWAIQPHERSTFEFESQFELASAACDPSFVDALDGWMPQVDRLDEWGLNEDPDHDADWYGPTAPLGLGIACPECSETWWHRDYYNDQFEVFNVDEMKMGVSACNIAGRPSIEAGDDELDHYGPTLRFRYRTEGNASTGQVYSNDLSEAEEGDSHYWYWEGTAAAGNNDFDWTIEIANARAADRFDVGFFYQHHGW